MIFWLKRFVVVCITLAAGASIAAAQPQSSDNDQAAPDNSKYILTPPAPDTPRINGAKIFGVRPGRPFLYTIPTTGDRPMTFAVDGLPDGLKLDQSTGQITGKLDKAGEYPVTFHAKNAKGEDSRPFRIVVGDTIGLTPPMGWNSWNCWAKAVDQEKVLAAAKAMHDSGLINHGWSYINIDDSWQGTRGGEFNGIQPNEKFPDMKGLADQIHAMGLKIGIYSTPWVTSYAGFCGGSSDSEDGKWSEDLNKREFRRDGKYPMAENDAKQWAAWGIDYLKYDWNPRSNPRVSDDFFFRQIGTMKKALEDSGRDLFFSYSNSMPFDTIETTSKMLNSWRTTGDIRDSWWSLTSIGFTQNRWAPFSGPGHWNDPDMLVVGYVGWGPNLHPSKLTANEQYTHISLWCLLSAPLLLGCDMNRMDPFTISLLSNDEVLAIDQDTLGKQASLVSEQGPEVTLVNKRRNRPDQTHQFKQGQVWARQLEDGSHAVGLFNTGDDEMKITANWSDIKIEGKQTVRDLWRQKDLGDADGKYEATVEPHGVVLLKFSPAK